MVSVIVSDVCSTDNSLREGQLHHGNLFYQWKQNWQHHKPSVIARPSTGGFPVLDRSNLLYRAEIATQKRVKNSVFARNDSCLIYDEFGCLDPPQQKKVYRARLY
jgi:hypothetical protein